MSGRIGAFASGSNLVIRMGDLQLAYGTNLSWSDDVAHAAVGGIGSYSYDALEPLQYLARGSFSLVRYSSAVRSKLGGTGFGAAPARSTAGVAGTDGNSMLRPGSFNPSALLISRSFDIDIYERKLAADSLTAGQVGGNALAGIKSPADMTRIFSLKDCRMTAYSITFTPGQLVSENIGFICILAGDALTQDLSTLG